MLKYSHWYCSRLSLQGKEKLPLGPGLRYRMSQGAEDANACALLVTGSDDPAVLCPAESQQEDADADDENPYRTYLCQFGFRQLLAS